MREALWQLLPISRLPIFHGGVCMGGRILCVYVCVSICMYICVSLCVRHIVQPWEITPLSRLSSHGWDLLGPEGFMRSEGPLLPPLAQ